MTGGPAAAPLRFAERMTGVEALMWRMGRRDARFRATMSLIVTLDGRVSRAAVESRLAALARAVPRLRDRVRDSPLGLVPSAWEPDPDFSLDAHLEEIPGPLWEVAPHVVAAPFDERRPPWRVVVVPSAEPAGDGVILHLHHSYTDGLGGMRLLGELFDLTGDTRPSDSPDLDGPPSEQPPAAGFETLLSELEAEVKRAVDVWSRALPWASRTLGAVRRDPGGLLHSAGDTVTSLQAQLGAAMGPASPVLSRRSAGVALVPLELDLEGMRATAGRVGTTVNDVYVAGLLDGLGRYHAKLGSVPPSLRLGIPISSRDSDTEMRNQLFGAVLRGPLGSLDFDERARLVHEIVLRGRKLPLAPVMEDLAAAAVRFPGGVPAVAAVLSSLDVLASNVVGPPVPMWLTGVPIRTMTPFGPRSGSAVNATLLSYDGTARIGLNLDPAAVPEPAVLVDCLETAFGDALSA